jgi:hypothetical protein
LSGLLPELCENPLQVRGQPQLFLQVKKAAESLFIAVLWIGIGSGSDFHFDADPDPDAEPTPSFTHVGNGIIQSSASLHFLSHQRHIGVIIFNILDSTVYSILNFMEKI